jgi:hypothetical protein
LTDDIPETVTPEEGVSQVFFFGHIPEYLDAPHHVSRSVAKLRRGDGNRDAAHLAVQNIYLNILTRHVLLQGSSQGAAVLTDARPKYLVTPFSEGLFPFRPGYFFCCGIEGRYPEVGVDGEDTLIDTIKNQRKELFQLLIHFNLLSNESIHTKPKHAIETPSRFYFLLLTVTDYFSSLLSQM